MWGQGDVHLHGTTRSGLGAVGPGRGRCLARPVHLHHRVRGGGGVLVHTRNALGTSQVWLRVVRVGVSGGVGVWVRLHGVRQGQRHRGQCSGGPAPARGRHGHRHRRRHGCGHTTPTTNGSRNNHRGSSSGSGSGCCLASHRPGPRVPVARGGGQGQAAAGHCLCRHLGPGQAREGPLVGPDVRQGGPVLGLHPEQGLPQGQQVAGAGLGPHPGHGGGGAASQVLPGHRPQVLLGEGVVALHHH